MKVSDLFNKISEQTKISEYSSKERVIRSDLGIYFDSSGRIWLNFRRRSERGGTLSFFYGIQFSSTNANVIKKIEEILEGLGISAHHSHINKEKMHTVGFRNLLDVEIFCRAILPYVKEKKEKCLLMLKFVNVRKRKKEEWKREKKKKGLRRTCASICCYSEEEMEIYKQFQEVCKQIKELKKARIHKCIKCGVELHVGHNWYFSFKRQYAYICKECEKKYSRGRFFKNREKIYAYHRKWDREHRELRRKYMKKWKDKNPDYYQKHKEQYKEYSRRNYLKHREKRLVSSGRWYATHKELYKKRRRERYLKNREKELAQCHSYYLRHREERLAYSKRYYQKNKEHLLDRMRERYKLKANMS